MLLAFLLAGAARAERPNVLDVALGGRSLSLSPEYERFFTPYLGAGAGLDSMAGFCLFGFCSGPVLGMNLFVSGKPLGDGSGPYFSAGAEWVHNFGNAGLKTEFVSGWKSFRIDPQGSEVLGNFEAGWQFEFRGVGGNAMVRPGFDLKWAPEGLVPWLGLTLGVAL